MIYIGKYLIKRSKKLKKIILFFLLILVSLTGCTKFDDTNTQNGNIDNTKEDEKLPDKQDNPSEPSKPTEPSEPTVIVEEKTLAEQTLEKMTLEEKIGQLLFVRPEVLDNGPQENATGINSSNANGTAYISENIISNLDKYKVGGVILFGKNIVDPEQTTAFIKELQNNSTYPLFIGVDEEGGIVARVANNPNFNVTQFPNMNVIGNTQDYSKAKEVGLTIGTYLKELGFNITFAPVADVNTNPQNIVIGPRAFGSDPSLVAKMVASELEGLHEANIMSCIKHFPGHGDTTDDTHSGYVAVNKTLEELKSCEFIPFEAGIEAKTDMIMIAHITANNVTNDNLPSTLSYKMVTNVLRNHLKYNGVVITDALEMGAIAQNYTCTEACVQSILAGVDILLTPQNLEEAYNGLLEAVAGPAGQRAGMVSYCAMTR